MHSRWSGSRHDRRRDDRQEEIGLRDLLNLRVPCNEAFAEDPTIQCRVDSVSLGDGFELVSTVSTFGLLNGIAGTHADGYGKIAAVYETFCPMHGSITPKPDVKTCPIDGCCETIKTGNIVGFVATRTPIPRAT